MIRKIKGWWRRFRKFFRYAWPARKESPMAEYDGARCVVYFTNGARLVGTVHLDESPSWIRLEDKSKSWRLRLSQIASIGRTV